MYIMLPYMFMRENFNKIRAPYFDAMIKVHFMKTSSTDL